MTADFRSGEFPALTLLRVVWRRAGLIVLCAVLAGAAAYGFSQLQEKEYSASASLLFREVNLDSAVFGSSQGTSVDPDREAATNVELVSLDVVRERTERRLGDPDAGDSVEIAAEGKSNVITATATDTVPRRAARIANAFAAEYIAFRREADRSKIDGALELVRRQLESLDPTRLNGPDGTRLQRREEQLELLSALQTGNAELVQRAEVPTSPSSPKVARNTAFGLVVGLLLGVGLALLTERLDRRIRDPKEVEELFRKPLLATIPKSDALNGQPANPGTREAEVFSMLRANLRYFNVNRELRSVLITSPTSGDGKTTVCQNLAGAAARSGARVLLVEGDLRRPILAKRLKIRPQPGLSGFLAGEAKLEDVVQTAGAVGSLFDIIVAGPVPPNPPDLVESRRMKEFIKNAEDAYDLVIIDTPPTSLVADAIPLVRDVGGVIVVSRLGATTRDAVTRLREQLENLDAPTLGVVVNSVQTRRGDYGAYAYGYEQSAYGKGS